MLFPLWNTASCKCCKQVRGCAEGPCDRAREEILSGVAVLGFADTFNKSFAKDLTHQSDHLVQRASLSLSLSQKMHLSSCEGNGIHEGKSGPISAESWRRQVLELCRQTEPAKHKQRRSTRVHVRCIRQTLRQCRNHSPTNLE